MDTDLAKPNPSASLTLRRDGIRLRPGDEVVTYVARNLEHYRGFHIFMRALPAILNARRNARVVIVGGDEVSYGPRPQPGTTWRQVMLKELAGQLDMSRVHFVGRVPYGRFVALMQVSAAHVYLTYPFVLSWSMLEAMSAGALVIGSRTVPVQEVIEDSRNGILRDFFDVGGIAEAVIEALAEPARFATIRRAARPHRSPRASPPRPLPAAAGAGSAGPSSPRGTGSMTHPHSPASRRRSAPLTHQ